MTAADITGIFISFEGGEGVGKSTQINLLAARLRERGHDVVVTREPGGTPGAEAIRTLLLSPDISDWDAPAEALLFAAARSDHVRHVIRPALAGGAVVLCDRYVDSTRAYQSISGALSDAQIMALHEVGAAALMPDRTLLLELCVEQAARRRLARDGATRDRFEARDNGFHRSVADAFARLAEREAPRWRRIDADAEPDAVATLVWSAVADMFA